MPSVVFSILRDLQVRLGDRVLEIGTGTGYNAALLGVRLGLTVTEHQPPPELSHQADALGTTDVTWTVTSDR